jgi:hypothetical protein
MIIVADSSLFISLVILNKLNILDKILTNEYRMIQGVINEVPYQFDAYLVPSHVLFQKF